MRPRPFLGIGATLASLISPTYEAALAHIQLVAANRHRIDFTKVGPKRVRTGDRYPHISDRQRARYARQIAAGQLNISRVGG